MRSRTRVLGGRSRRLAAVGGIGVGVALTAQLSATAVTTSVGQTLKPDAANSCIPAGPLNTSLELFQTSRADGTSYVIPGDGVITSWSFQGSDVQGSQVTLRVFRAQPTGTPDAGPDRFAPVGDGGPIQVVGDNQEFVFPARLSVKAGDVVGLRSEKIGLRFAGTCAATGGIGDTYRLLAGTAPTGVGVFASYAETSGLKIDVAAKVEQDVDGDGYGDDTQDACPRLRSTQKACPIPKTTITRRPPSPTRHHTARLRFTSNVAGATFRCKLDAHRYKSCTSPHVFTVRPGRHTFLVRAHANRATDPTPARARWRVTR
jgi:hypothetical protein